MASAPICFSLRFAAPRLSPPLAADYEGRAAGCPACPHEVDAAVDGPDCRYAQRQQWFLDRAVTQERPGKVEDHAGQVCQQSEERNQRVAQETVLRMSLI